MGKGHKIKGKKVIVHEKSDGIIDLFCNGLKLEYTVYGQSQYKPKFATRKDLDQLLDQKQRDFLMHKKINDNGQRL